MGGMMIFGIVLVAVGLSITLLTDLAATVVLAAGIIVAVAGGAAAVLGGVLHKLWGSVLLALGIAVAAMGVFMRFLLDLWIVQWIIGYGGMIMVIIGIIMAAIGLIGMFKRDGGGRDDIAKRLEKLMKESERGVQGRRQ